MDKPKIIEGILEQVLMKHHDDISKQDDDAIAEASEAIRQILEKETLRFDFKCGCFLMIFIGHDIHLKAALSCCQKHEHPYAKTEDFYLNEKIDSDKIIV